MPKPDALRPAYSRQAALPSPHLEYESGKRALFRIPPERHLIARLKYLRIDGVVNVHRPEHNILVFLHKYEFSTPVLQLPGSVETIVLDVNIEFACHRVVLTKGYRQVPSKPLFTICYVLKRNAV